MPLTFRVGDRVKIIARDYEGHTGKIIDVDPKDPSLPYKLRLDNGVIAFKGEKTIEKIKRGRKPKDKNKSNLTKIVAHDSVEEKVEESVVEQIVKTCPVIELVEQKEREEETKEMEKTVKNETPIEVSEQEEIIEFDLEEYIASKRMSYCVGKAIITLSSDGLTKEDVKDAIALLVKEHKALDGE